MGMGHFKFMLAFCLTASYGFLLDDNTLQNLISLITEEKKRRVALEKDIQALRTNIGDMKTNYQSSLCNCATSGVVAFTATLTTDISNFGTNQPLVFDRVITNVGGAYDARHGLFRAPVDGVYRFSFSVLQGTGSMWIGLELVKDGDVISRIKTGDSGYWNMGANTVNIHMRAGNDVWVRHMSDSDTKQVLAQGGFFTLISGHLISAD